MAENLEAMQRQVKDNIATLINSDKLHEAKMLLSEYMNMVKDDREAFSMQGIIAIKENQLGDAEKLFRQGLSINKDDFDLQYNLAYVYQLKKDYVIAANLYYQLSKGQYSKEQTDIARQTFDELSSYFTADQPAEEKKKLVFFVKKDLDSFLGDIINAMSSEYETKKVIVTDLKQIEPEMKWADICWFEWCDELVGYGSRLPLAKEKKIFCRLHRYEVFTDHPTKVYWENIDSLIIVTSHLERFLLQQISNLRQRVNIITIENGVHLDKYQLIERNPGFNIAYIGYIHSRKNPVLLLQIIYELIKLDKRYKLYLAGQFQEPLVELYWNYQVQQMGLQDHVIFQGWQSNISEWLKDKNYLLSTSIHESFGYGIAEAMAQGIKPIIHNFICADEVWDKKYLFNTISEAVNSIISDNYNSQEYRRYIEDNYSLSKQIVSIKNLLTSKQIEKKPSILESVQDNLKQKQTIKNLEDITILMTTYNRSDILIGDLERGFKLGLVPKVIVDDCSNAKHRKAVKKVEKRFGVQKVIRHTVNQGPAAARKTGFMNIDTANVLSLDDDDILLCLNDGGFTNDMKMISKSDIAIIVPRYILNLDQKNTLSIGYDRIGLNNAFCGDVLKQFFLTGEMAAFNAGAVYNTKSMHEMSAENIFRVSEDFVSLSRLFGNNLNKKVFVSENYVYIRRINPASLSGNINGEKLSMQLLSLLVAAYYCIKNELFTQDQVIAAISNRGKLLQNSYKFGEQFAEQIIKYLQGKTALDFAGDVLKSSDQEEITIPEEFIKIRDCMNKCNPDMLQ
ncbi:MAG: glycosyl transferase group 1 [Firmicutes bacterium]|nr:glycosyl transferase group 1 [Bacillota bacterium]